MTLNTGFYQILNYRDSPNNPIMPIVCPNGGGGAVGHNSDGIDILN